MIRRATDADLETVLRLQQAYYTYDGIDFDETRIRPAMVRLLGDPALGQVSLALIAGQAAGYAVGTFAFDVEFGGKYVMLTDLYVEPAHRGAGHGRALLASIVEMAREAGAGAVEGQVIRGNERAQAFYRAWGFSFPDRLLMSLKL